MPIKRALVVDDSKAAGLALRRMLEQHSVAVDLADSGEAAISYLKGQTPDIIFMDHIMPGMNGLQATKAISEDPQTATIPVVMYTSTEGDSYIEKAKAHGAVGILRKPPKPAVLAQWLQQLNGASEPVAAPAPAALPPAAVAPAPPPVPSTSTPVPAAMSAEQIETLARGAAESVVRNSTRTLIARTMEEQLPQVRQDILARCETIAKQAAAEFLHARVNELANQLRVVQEQLTQLNTRPTESSAAGPATIAELETLARAIAEHAATEAAAQTAQSVAHDTATAAAARVASETAHRIAEEFYDARVTPLAAQLQSEIRTQFAELSAQPSTPAAIGPGALEEIANSARAAATQIATATATTVAAETAQRVAQDAAQQAARDIATGTDTTRRAAEEFFTARSAELLDQLKRDVAAQLAELSARPVDAAGGLDATVLEEVKSVARHVAGQRATESAQKAVHEAVQHSSQDVAKQAARMAARQLDKALDIALRAQTGRIYLLTAAAAAAGVFAAFIVHLLH